MSPRPEDSLQGCTCIHTHTYTRTHTQPQHWYLTHLALSPPCLCLLAHLAHLAAGAAWAGVQASPQPCKPSWPCSRPAVCPAHGDSGPAASYPQGTRVSATRSPAHLSSFTALLCLRGRKKGQRRVQPGQRSPVSSPKLCVVAPESLLVMARVNLSMHPPVPPPHPLALGCLGAGWWDGPSADFTPPSSSLNTGAPRLAELLVNG